MSRTKDYFPGESKFMKLEDFKYQYEYGDFVECVETEIRNGNKSAEGAMVKYLSSFLTVINERGYYSSSEPFFILGSTNGNEVNELLE